MNESRLRLFSRKTSLPEAVELFFTAWRENASDALCARLQELLGAVLCEDADIGVSGFIVIPRIGTISPWSSKATGIAHRCGLAELARVERGWWYPHKDIAEANALHDRMREKVFSGNECGHWRHLFPHNMLVAVKVPPTGRFEATKSALAEHSQEHGIGLTSDDIDYLVQMYAELGCQASFSELMMFAQANSEHCRHKFFNARWQRGSEDTSLMSFIRATHKVSPQGVITAFNDNSAVIRANAGADFAAEDDGIYKESKPNEGLYIVAKAETHNHPTAISPYPGAATGSGGEIRDEAAAGRGAVARAGFSGYIVSTLDGENNSPPKHIASARQIMTEAPIGAAAYNNEFGRPALSGFFRTYQEEQSGRHFGYHKPVMLAGGIGHMLPYSAGKQDLPPESLIVVLGGESFRIGMGGGAASSRSGGADEGLDFASVQRDNAEMQRRAQQVLETLRRRENNPILSLHDVGAGGLSNAVTELVHSASRGALVDMEKIPIKEWDMSPEEIWCNESQERYVLAIAPEHKDEFEKVCKRECCPFAFIGEVTEKRDIVAHYHGQPAVNLPLDKVLSVPNNLHIQVLPLPAPAQDGAPKLAEGQTFATAAKAVLRHPTVACKRFLVTIGDRTVGGLTAREQMVGPWQTPVADCAAICHDFTGHAGAVFALGERAGAAALRPDAAVRLAISEALLNLFAAEVKLKEVKFSLNWMANCDDQTRQSELYAAVEAASEFCIALGVGVIVGKDSLFMRMPSRDGKVTVESPAFAAAFAFAPLADVNRILTPQLSGREDTYLMHMQLTAPALGGSIAAQAGVFSPLPQQVADVSAETLGNALRALAQCHKENLLLAYHDCSDGGLWATLCEMAFASNCGLNIFPESLAQATETDGSGNDGWEVKAAQMLFNEAPAAVLEVAEEHAARVMEIFAEQQITIQTAARPNLKSKTVCVRSGEKQELLNEPLADLRRIWEEVSNDIAGKRDNPECIQQEAEREMDGDPGLFARLPENMPAAAPTPAIGGKRPRVAILREVGTNGQREMAAAFTYAGFEAVDVTMQDLLDGRHKLDAQFSGAALCGGFSYGDVLGAGRGWALSVLHHPKLKEMFSAFFAREDTFTLGVCNGCQALAHLQELMPQAEEWCFPDFLPNLSQRFEARLSMVEVLPTPSLFFSGLETLQFPIVVSHGEGRADFSRTQMAGRERAATVMRYLDNHGKPTTTYPANPNGSPDGATGFCSPDGRITLMMPHPERIYRRVQMGWQPPQIKGEEYTPWKLLFDNARGTLNS